MFVVTSAARSTPSHTRTFRWRRVHVHDSSPVREGEEEWGGTGEGRKEGIPTGVDLKRYRPRGTESSSGALCYKRRASEPKTVRRSSGSEVRKETTREKGVVTGEWSSSQGLDADVGVRDRSPGYVPSVLVEVSPDVPDVGAVRPWDPTLPVFGTQSHNCY